VDRMTGAHGFSLVEVIVAAGLLAGAVLSVAQLFAAATTATADARATGEATALAWQKAEELRSLAFGSDDAGVPVTDTSSDTASVPERPAGGTGLSAVAGALERDTEGNVDYLDELCQPLGGGPQPPRGARYRRRWAVDAAGPDLLIVRVRVLPIGRDADLASVVTMRARKAP
jgi:type II secretory pathway pseudopilin PulG